MGQYLNESRLKDILHTSKYTFIHNKGFCKGIRYRPDFRCDELMLIIEFDGYQHYNNFKTQKRDKIKHNLYHNHGYTVINIPYFIQLTECVYDRIFVGSGFDLYIDKSILIEYPHGFHDNKAMTPIDFNLIGMNRFLLEMSVVFREESYEVFSSILTDITDMVLMNLMEDMIKYLNGFVDSGFDVNGMLKHIYEK